MTIIVNVASTTSHDAIVSQTNGNPGTRLTKGASQNFAAYDGNTVTVNEATPLVETPDPGAGPEPTDPA